MPVTKPMVGTSMDSAKLHMRPVPTLAPPAADTTSTAPSSARSAICPSAWKFESPGVSTSV